MWLFDLGMAEKVRPALVVSVGYGDVDRALITIVPHTTSLRGSQYEITVNVPFLKAGRVPGPEPCDISERQGYSKVGDAQTRSVQFGLRRASSLARWRPRIRRKGLAIQGLQNHSPDVPVTSSGRITPEPLK